jgi:methylenetetrahydrofolate reductase (NADPH)
MHASNPPISNLMTKIRAGEFILTGELEPGRTTNMDLLLEEANAMRPYVAAANVTDNPGSFVAINGLAATTFMALKTDLELIYQLTCRDSSRLGLASQLLGAAAVGIKNVLVLTGDHPILGDVPQSRPVFDLDSTQLLQLAREIVDQRSIYGVKLDEENHTLPHFHIGIGANPNTDHIDAELIKIERKVELGAEFIQTQVIYDLEKTESFFSSLKKFGLPVLVGLFPMRNYSTARDFNKLIPGVHVPKDILDKMKKIHESSLDKKAKYDSYDKINIDLFIPIMKELKKKGYAAGVHITAVHYTRIFPKLLS